MSPHPPAGLPPAEAEALALALNERFASSVAVTAHPLGPMTTYRVGGDASVYVLVESRDDLFQLAEVVQLERVPVSVIGRGSNMLVADAGFQGIVVHLGEEFATTATQADETVRVGGAASLPVVARQLTSVGRLGFEWAVGVPGSLGGAVRMNAGGHGSDMAASVRRVTFVDLATGDIDTVDAASVEFGYRTSAVRPEQVVVSADLELGEGDPEVGGALLTDIVRWRREHQPGGQNAGSVFTNPAGDSAGRLIDVAGLKGFRLGTASVSEKHANFIQADPGGRAGDIVALMREIVRRVHDQFGVVLRAETRMLGFGPEETALMFNPGEGE